MTQIINTSWLAGMSFSMSIYSLSLTHLLYQMLLYLFLLLNQTLYLHNQSLFLHLYLLSHPLLGDLFENPKPHLGYKILFILLLLLHLHPLALQHIILPFSPIFHKLQNLPPMLKHFKMLTGQKLCSLNSWLSSIIVPGSSLNFLKERKPQAVSEFTKLNVYPQVKLTDIKLVQQPKATIRQKALTIEIDSLLLPS